MLYFSSQATSDGRMNLTVTFALGTDLDRAQVQEQNRVNSALPRLPQEVQRLGVVAEKSSPDLTMVVHLYSPENTHDTASLSNYADLYLKDQIKRLSGVGDVNMFGGSQYSMRLWLNPDALNAINESELSLQLLVKQNEQHYFTYKRYAYANNAFLQAEAMYEEGQIPYLELLDARQDVLTAQEGDIDSTISTLFAKINTYHAFNGHWSYALPRTTPENTGSATL